MHSQSDGTSHSCQDHSTSHNVYYVKIGADWVRQGHVLASAACWHAAASRCHDQTSINSIRVTDRWFAHPYSDGCGSGMLWLENNRVSRLLVHTGAGAKPRARPCAKSRAGKGIGDNRSLPGCGGRYGDHVRGRWSWRSPERGRADGPGQGSAECHHRGTFALASGTLERGQQCWRRCAQACQPAAAGSERSRSARGVYVVGRLSARAIERPRAPNSLSRFRAVPSPPLSRRERG